MLSFAEIRLPFLDRGCLAQNGLHIHLGYPLGLTLHSSESLHLLENVVQPSIVY